MTVAHAQAWALIATDEARCNCFTRASMSSAKAIRLVQMLGLHRLDDPDSLSDMSASLAPPTCWTDLEERRRTFWGVFCLDSHAAISTGWPTQIDPEDVSYHPPSEFICHNAYSFSRSLPTSLAPKKPSIRRGKKIHLPCRKFLRGLSTHHLPERQSSATFSYRF
jgi:hypothetical protein